MSARPIQMSEARSAPNPNERIDLLLRDLRSSRAGLSQREAERRLLDLRAQRAASGAAARRWPRELARQFTHPLALLLWGAAALAAAAGIVPVAIAVVVVIVLNAAFAFVQEQQAERAVEALRPLSADAGDGAPRRPAGSEIEAARLVPGDILAIAEGERISADARLIEGALEVDMSTLTGESATATALGGDASTPTGR